MKITYITNAKIEVDHTTPSFFLTSNGSYLFESVHDLTQYTGYVLAQKTNDGWEMYKFIHSILPKDCESLEIQPTIVTAHTPRGYVSYEVDSCIRLLHNCTIPLILDCRHIYDFSDMNRLYSYTKINDSVTVYTYVQNERKMFVAVHTDAQLLAVEKWNEANYPFDSHRHASPSSSYVYYAADIVTNTESVTTIACGFTQEEALSKLQIPAHGKTPRHTAIMSEDNHVQVAYDFSVQSVYDLQKENGFYAGLPWFFQLWTRDESISLGSLIRLGDTSVVKQVIFRQLESVLDDGRIANRYPHSDLGSADGIGWTCVRISQLKWDTQEAITVRKKLLESLHNLEHIYCQDGLIFNKPLETWMDTGAGYDERSGFRVEIQALYLAQLKAIMYLNETINDGKFSYMKTHLRDVKKKVKEKLFDTILHDGFMDDTLRPNVFLAYYIFPELLTQKQWEKTFDTVLEKTWLSWGGVSTIDTAHPLFQPQYTGQTNESYHRGDSWYWVNNLVGVCLHRLNKKKYAQKISMILTASTREILESGSCGRHAEVSDAESITSYGTLFQLWSSAMFVELVHELKQTTNPRP